MSLKADPLFYLSKNLPPISVVSGKQWWKVRYFTVQSLGA